MEDLVDEAKVHKRLIWLDATGEIQFLDAKDQNHEEWLQAEAITRELMEDDALRGLLHNVLLQRRVWRLGLSWPLRPKE